MSETPDDVVQIDADTLIGLYNQDIKAMSDSAQMRGTVAARIKGLQESHGLNTQAYRIAKTIRKQPNGKREQLWKAVQHYCETLGVEQQKDLLDTITDNRAGKATTPLEDFIDGVPRTEPDRADAGQIGSVYTPSSDMGRHALADLDKDLDAMTTHETVNTLLENFCREHPRLADRAQMQAVRRITAIDADAGGGEDLRPKSLRDAGPTEAQQAADTGKATAKPKPARPAKPKPTGDKPKRPGKANGAAGAVVH